MKCTGCGKFMTKVSEWDEYPLGPYVNTEYKCICGNTRIHSDDFRLKTRGSEQSTRDET